MAFHPEVAHTEHGRKILENFLFDVCACRGDWTIASFVEEAVAEVRRLVGDERVVCALSGGVDSSVMALLLHKALGPRLTCIFVDNGVLRKGEADQVVRDFRERYHLEVRYADEAQRFLARLSGVDEPGAKAQDHRRGVHRGVRRARQGAGRTSRSWRRGRSTRTGSSRPR